jgi:hypothetical protein
MYIFCMHNIKGRNSANLVAERRGNIDRVKGNQVTIIGLTKIKKDEMSRPFFTHSFCKNNQVPIFELQLLVIDRMKPVPSALGDASFARNSRQPILYQEFAVVLQ